MQNIRFKKLEWKFKETNFQYDSINKPSKQISEAQDIWNLFYPYFHELAVENFVVILLGTTNRIQGFDIVSSGSLNSTIVTPREIFRSAIAANCANIILTHNHPSGDCEPSNEDIQITKKLIECGKILDIQIFDHIVFGNKLYCSMQERRLI